MTQQTFPESYGSTSQAERERLRALGLRPIEIWVPNTGSPEFAREAHRQSLAVARSTQSEADQQFVESISEESGR